jgi:primosomal protein N' (replication factor Y)
VAGRAGRGPRGGLVLIQTALPHHYAISSAITHDFESFAARELEERAGPGYPPHNRMVNVVVSGTDERAVQDAADEAASHVMQLLAEHRAADAVTLTGPAPCPIDRIRGRWRWHFLLRSRSAAVLGQTCHRLARFDLRPGRADLRMIIDRDAVSLL